MYLLCTNVRVQFICILQVMVKDLEHVVSMVLNSFQHPHPRVRWAAINAIGQLSTDLGPDLQIQFHQHVLPALAAAMDDFQNPRVQVCDQAYLLHYLSKYDLCGSNFQLVIRLIEQEDRRLNSPCFPNLFLLLVINFCVLLMSFMLSS